MELNITRLVNEGAAIDYSCSRAERGDYAGPGSWQSAVEDGADFWELSDDQIAEARDYFLSFGAWDKAEVAAWTAPEVLALVLQEVSAQVREFQDACNSDWNEYRKDSESGRVSGALYNGDDDQVYCYLGN